MSALEKMLQAELPFMVMEERPSGAKLLKWYDGKGVKHEHWYLKKTLDTFMPSGVVN